VRIRFWIRFWDGIYKSVENIKNYDLGEIISAINQPAKVTVNIERETVKAKQVWRKFSDYYGY